MGPKKSPVSPFRPAAAAFPPCRAASRPPGAPRSPRATQRAGAPPAAPPGVRPPCLGSVGANCQQRSSGEWRHHLAEGMVFNMFPWVFLVEILGNSIVGALPSAESFSFSGFIYCRWNPPKKQQKTVRKPSESRKCIDPEIDQGLPNVGHMYCCM